MADRLLIETVAKLRSMEKRLDKMTLQEVDTESFKNYKAISPDPNIMSYEVSVLRQKLEEHL